MLPGNSNPSMTSQTPRTLHLTLGKLFSVDLFASDVDGNQVVFTVSVKNGEDKEQLDDVARVLNGMTVNGSSTQYSSTFTMTLTKRLVQNTFIHEFCEV